MKEFPTNAVISAISGYLVCPIDEVYEVLSYMAGEPVYTHQLPRLGREARPVVVRCHPALLDAIREAEGVNRENWREWRDLWLSRYGPTMAVPRMDVNEHERIDPLSELVEKVHPGNVVVVAGSDDPGV